MLSVALTGNIAAGKSSVVDLFRRWGATVIDADQLVREAQRPGTEVMQAIAFRFGRDVILPGGELDRAALRGKVMGDDASLADLNAIVHPAVRRERDRLLAAARARGDRIVINDIPLLFEAADPADFDLVVMVDAPEDLRRRRLMDYRGLSTENAEKAVRAQQPSTPKRARSDFVIENVGTREELEQAARTVWDELERRAGNRSSR
jgi:dephospho-CoA kinase